MFDQFHKYIQGELSDREKDLLFQALDKDEAARKEFTQLHNTWGYATFLSQPDDEQTAARGREHLQKRLRKKTKQPVFLQLFKYAAILCITFASAWYLFDKQAETASKELYTLIQVPMGQRVHLTFSDSSSVWLSPKSQIKIPNEFSRKDRVVELDGEGFFTVAKDNKRPFIVKSKGYNIQVLGTRFNVFAYNQSPKFETCLIDGKVHIYNEENPSDSLYLLPNEKASLVDNLLSRSVSDYQNEEFLATGIYNFQSVPFIDILDYLSLWYDVRFRISGSVLLSTRITGKFRQSDEVENILTALQNIFQFEFKNIEDNLYEIYK
ncbi:FecR family protein [Parabacteroides sp. OttesenSCG-928-K15]|nr:FecR family protein [Parabacteroides sp. OttesenSCG-928-K15]